MSQTGLSALAMPVHSLSAVHPGIELEKVERPILYNPEKSFNNKYLISKFYLLKELFKKTFNFKTI